MSRTNLITIKLSFILFLPHLLLNDAQKAIFCHGSYAIYNEDGKEVVIGVKSKLGIKVYVTI